MLGEKTAALARAHGAKSAAVALLAAADINSEESAPRRHEHVHDLQHRVHAVASPPPSLHTFKGRTPL